MIESKFDSLLVAIENCFPSVREVLNPPATEAELTALAVLYSAPLPQELVALLRVNNGQSKPTPYALGGFSLYSAKSIERMRTTNNFNNSNPHWIPIGYAEPFELIIESNPDSATNNHVFVYDAETGPAPPIATCLSQYMEFTTEKIIAGEYRKLLEIMMIHHDEIIAG